MGDTNIALLAGLVGSILTVLITKVFDIFQKRLEFRSELRKEYFIKKINSLEKASIQYSLAISAIGNIAKLFAITKENEIFFDDKVLQPFMENLNNQFEKITEATNDIGLAIFNYLDIDQNEFYDFTKVEDTLKLIGNIGYHQNQLLFLADLKNRLKNTNSEKEIIEKFNKEREELIDLSQKLSKQFEEAKEIYYKIQRKIRIELKKYDK